MQSAQRAGKSCTLLHQLAQAHRHEARGARREALEGLFCREERRAMENRRLWSRTELLSALLLGIALAACGSTSAGAPSSAKSTPAVVPGELLYVVKGGDANGPGIVAL